MERVCAIAADYDGTLAREGVLGAEVREALARVRGAGLPAVLVTGRRLPDLLRVCPEAGALFDRIVAENGAVLEREGKPFALAEPVPPALEAALAVRGIPIASGAVLIGTEVRFEDAVREEMRRLGLQLRLVRNRDSLMVLPPAVSKASGLSHALASLGLDEADTVAFGDAENDRELLESCGVGVAVSDAVDELKRVADVVLERANGSGVAEYLTRIVVERE